MEPAVRVERLPDGNPAARVAPWRSNGSGVNAAELALFIQCSMTSTGSFLNVFSGFANSFWLVEGWAAAPMLLRRGPASGRR